MAWLDAARLFSLLHHRVRYPIFDTADVQDLLSKSRSPRTLACTARCQRAVRSMHAAHTAQLLADEYRGAVCKGTQRLCVVSHSKYKHANPSHILIWLRLGFADLSLSPNARSAALAGRAGHSGYHQLATGHVHAPHLFEPFIISSLQAMRPNAVPGGVYCTCTRYAA